MNRHKLLQAILDNPRNVRFEDLTRVVEGFGFRLDRISGSHHLDKRTGSGELVSANIHAKFLGEQELLRPLMRSVTHTDDSFSSP